MSVGEGLAHAVEIAAALGLRAGQVTATIDLLDAGNTLPFIARYRKEQTGGLTDEQISLVQAQLVRLRAVDQRRAVIVAALEEQGKLTAALAEQLRAATTLTALEDLYQPFKVKRRTRATIAREQGLEPLAMLIMQQVRTPRSAAELAQPFMNAEVPTVEAALAGAQDIVAEMISDHPDVRRQTREQALRWGQVACEKRTNAEDARQVFQTYYGWRGRVDRMRPYQTLAINRGEAEEVLRVRVEVAARDWQTVVGRVFRPDPRSPLAEDLARAINDAAERLLLPAIERDVRRNLSEHAETHAIQAFATNLQALLLGPPLAQQTVLGIDPGFRTGCKVAVVGPTGRLLATATIYPHAPQQRWDAAVQTLHGLIAKHEVTLIAIGNGTASRETEQLTAAVLRARGSGKYMLVNEAGASVYSASPLARAELPELDVSLRGAVSIARRVQDPLAELVKIEPKAIGVGLYQHDVDQGKLEAALTEVVERAVNQVGVDVNTASPALLTYVAGIGPKMAERIVAHRDAHGQFAERTALKKVTGLGPKTFEQAAGFLRILGGANPLDASAIHPESYAIARAVLDRAKVTLAQPLAERQAALDQLLAAQPLAELAAALGTGVPTLSDIVAQLRQPGRDPRADLAAPLLRSDVLALDDLQPGLRLQGTVRNVVEFGVFVDVGVKQDGLLHRTEVPPGVRLRVGDVIEVVVQQVEVARGRIGLAWPTDTSF